MISKSVTIVKCISENKTSTRFLFLKKKKIYHKLKGAKILSEF